MSNPAIRLTTEQWVKDESFPGILSYRGQRTIQQVHSSLVKILSNIKFDDLESSAFHHAEWITNHSRYNFDCLFPRGELLVALREGSNRGSLIQIISHNLDDESMIPVFTMKYFLSEHHLWHIVRSLHASIYALPFKN